MYGKEKYIVLKAMGKYIIEDTERDRNELTPEKKKKKPHQNLDNVKASMSRYWRVSFTTILE